MQLRTLGAGGLRVSPLALGTMGFGGGGGFSAAGRAGVTEAREQIDLCLEAGVNLFDTADIYSDGAAEEILGRALGQRRDDVLVATKVGGGRGPQPLARKSVIASCEASLRRLRTDRIDLYQVHRWDASTPLDETLGALDTLVTQGKVRSIGCSNYAGWQLMKALAVSERGALARFCSHQVYYSLIAREAEYELLPLATDQAIGILVWSPLAGGYLTGKYPRGQPAPAGTRRAAWGDPGVIDDARGRRVLGALDEIAAAHRTSSAQVALRWLIDRPAVTSLIVGARDRDQLAANLAAADLALPDEHLRKLDEVSAPPEIYPHWHQRRESER